MDSPKTPTSGSIKNIEMPPTPIKSIRNAHSNTVCNEHEQSRRSSNAKRRLIFDAHECVHIDRCQIHHKNICIFQLNGNTITTYIPSVFD